MAYLFQGDTTSVYGVDLFTGQSTLLKQYLIPSGPGKKLNAFGFNRKDNFIWGYRITTNELIRLASDMSYSLYPITGLPSNKSFNIGDIDASGILYLAKSDFDTVYRINLDPSSSGYLQLLPPLVITASSNSDWVVSPVDNKLYAVDSLFQILRFDPTTGMLSVIGIVNGGGVQNVGFGSFGAVYMDNLGSMYLSENYYGNIYQIATPHSGNTTATFFSSGPASNNNDGARCPLSPVCPPLPYQDTIAVFLCPGSSFLLPGGNAVSAAGFYTDTLITGKGCDSILHTQVYNVPGYTITDTVRICPDENYTLPGGSIVTLPGHYTDSFMTIYECDSVLYTELLHFPEILDSIEIHHLTCNHSSDGRIYFHTNGQGAPYSFNLYGQSDSTGSFFGNLTAGHYHYLIYDQYGCSVQGDISITEPGPVNLKVQPLSSSVEYGTTVYFEASSAYSDAIFSWHPSFFLQCDSCATTSSFPQKDIQYTITAAVGINGDTCRESVKTEIFMNPAIYMPNALTPNHDGKNDLLRLSGSNLENVENFNIRIFSRWGQPVYESNDPEFEWDPNLDHALESIYYYTVYFMQHHTAKKTEKKGSITIIR